MTNTQNNNMPYIIIIILLIVIAVLAFFLGQASSGTGDLFTKKPTPLTVTVIDDKRCTDCGTQEIITQLSGLPFLASAKIDVQDFSENGSEQILKDAGITRLPAIIFSSNAISDLSFTQYLSPTQDGKFQLQVGASFDPYATRSERGFLVMKEWELETVTQSLYFSGNQDAEILWVEYSDLGCGACKQFHSSGISEAALKAYPDTLSKAMVWFLSVGWPTSVDAMHAIECMAEQNGSLHGQAWNNFYKAGSYSKSELEDFAKENGVNVDTYNECIAGSEIKAKVENNKNLGISVFGITGTPGNILINKNTGEYISAGWDIESNVAKLLTQ